ncbi:MAG: hypothetical protein MI749_10030, partial [Desulfovibrionales bacterium]|nr:hypothetical protein [Desulfovibrionales bacterium]
MLQTRNGKLSDNTLSVPVYNLGNKRRTRDEVGCGECDEVQDLHFGRKIARLASTPQAEFDKSSPQVMKSSRGWARVNLIDKSQYPAVNFQASRDIFSAGTTKGRQQLRQLANAYSRGEPVSTPGAETTLETAANLISKLIDENKPQLKEEEIDGLRDFSEWIDSVKEAGCLHDETEQVCTCLGYIQDWFDSLPHGRKNRPLSSILNLPWKELQSNKQAFMEACERQQTSYRGWPISSGDLVNAVRWPRLCTYQVLSMPFIFSTMGLTAVVKGFMVEMKGFHDGQWLNTIEIPAHDLIHADQIVSSLIKHFLSLRYPEY